MCVLLFDGAQYPQVVNPLVLWFRSPGVAHARVRHTQRL